jgi:hypothetical protein
LIITYLESKKHKFYWCRNGSSDCRCSNISQDKNYIKYSRTKRAYIRKTKDQIWRKYPNNEYSSQYPK